MSETKRITSIKRSSLAGLSYEWGDECYAYVTPATPEDILATDEVDVEKLTKREQLEYQFKLVREHFVSGKIKVFDGEKFELTDMVVEDCLADMDIANQLYADIIGFDLDPKDLRKAAEQSALQESEEKPTETTSSEISQ